MTPAGHLLRNASCSWATAKCVDDEGGVWWEGVAEAMPVLSDGERVIVAVARAFEDAAHRLDVKHCGLIAEAARLLDGERV